MPNQPIFLKRDGPLTLLASSNDPMALLFGVVSEYRGLLDSGWRSPELMRPISYGQFFSF
ncbi:MAG: hypothetical protein KDJ28_03785 [Candidatus Competibacteraceae bacterium]|nr:hypothetical protein [Candidatus Competibacteraceae bacterium]